ncbi:MAG: GNAT family N-acetyltransferase [Erythrobacter sp.]
MSGNDWSLRLARASDADDLPAIEQAAGKLFEGDPDLAEVDFDDTWEADELRRLIGKGHCLVSECDGQIVGFIATEPFNRELHIWEMDVLPQYQKRGIGAGLIRACQIDARNSGISALTLTTFRDVAWNAPFYARLGFEEVTALDAHPRLASELALEADNGLPIDRRCAMICFLD